MDPHAYKTAQKMHRAREGVRASLAELSREQRLQVLLEMHAEVEAEKPSLPSLPYFNPLSSVLPTEPLAPGPLFRPANLPPEAPRPALALPVSEPATGTLRADILRVLRETTEPLRTGELTRRVSALRGESVKMPSVASAVWQFVRDGRARKASVRGHDYYAAEQTTLDQWERSLALDGDIPAPPTSGADEKGGTSVPP